MCICWLWAGCHAANSYLCVRACVFSKPPVPWHKEPQTIDEQVELQTTCLRDNHIPNPKSNQQENAGLGEAHRGTRDKGQEAPQPRQRPLIPAWAGARATGPHRPEKWSVAQGRFHRRLEGQSNNDPAQTLVYYNHKSYPVLVNCIRFIKDGSIDYWKANRTNAKPLTTNPLVVNQRHWCTTSWWFLLLACWKAWVTERGAGWELLLGVIHELFSAVFHRRPSKCLAIS